MSDEFRRLLDDAPDAELRSVLESGLADQPSPRAITRAARTLGIGAAGLISARAAAAAASRALRASPWTALAKWGGAGFLLGGIALSPVVLKMHTESRARVAQQSVPRANDHPASDAPGSSNPPESAPTERTDAAADLKARTPNAENSAEQPAESATPLAPSEPESVAPKSGPSANVASANVASAASQARLHSADPPLATSGVPDANSATNANAAAKRADPLDSEITLLDSTRTALKQGDASTALALLDRHAQLSVRTLSAEALVLRVQALMLARRSDEARALARAALSGKNALPYAARLRKLAGLVE